MNTTDAVHDHALAIVFEGITDPVKRTTFFRANKAALAREAARREAGRALPSSPNFHAKVETVKPGLTVRRNGVVMRHIPSRGLFGQ